LNKRQDYY